MHPNSAYRQVPADANLAFARERGFGIISINGQDGPLSAHVPFILGHDGATLAAHLVRSNPVARMIATPVNALVMVSGPDAYVSPDWYGLDHQVPTWNYVAVHLRGMLALAPPETLRSHLDDLSARFEDRLLPKPPWLVSKMPDDALDRMMRQIVPVTMTITDVQGTWKLGQNKPTAARMAAADHMQNSALGSEPLAIATLMRNATP